MVKLDKNEVLSLYHEGTGASPGQRDRCLSADEIAAMATGELPPNQQIQAAAHMEACGHCAEEYQIVLPLESWAAKAAREVSRDSTPKIVQIGSIHSNDDAARTGLRQVAPSSRRSRPFLASPAVSYAIAACLLVAISLLGFWVSELRRQNQETAKQLFEERRAAYDATSSLQELQRRLDDAVRERDQKRESKEDETQIAGLIDEFSRPMPNAPIFDVEPQGSIRGENKGGAIEVPRGANQYTLILNLAGEHSRSGYELDIIRAAGSLVWRGKVRKSQENTFTIGLNRRALQAGEYHFKIYGVDSGRRELVQDDVVRIRYR